jgi:hypothetical protein
LYNEDRQETHCSPAQPGFFHSEREANPFPLKILHGRLDLSPRFSGIYVQTAS